MLSAALQTLIRDNDKQTAKVALETLLIFAK